MAVNGVGQELRQERLRQGLTLDDMVLRTRIQPKSLEAIEADAFDQLPGTVFARGFVRQYAMDLKLDPEALLARLPRVDIDAAPLPNPPNRPGRAPWDPRLTAALVSVLWIVTATGAGMGAWYYVNHHGRHFGTTVSSAPVPAAPQTVSSPGSGRSASPLMAPGFDSSRPVQVILTAREASWVQVSADGRTAFTGILRPHDTRSIAADAQVKIVTGNAGGLDISLNGKALEPIGPSGQVRTVSLTAAGPQFAPQSQPASSPL